jgi:hypothetical protein
MRHASASCLYIICSTIAFPSQGAAETADGPLADQLLNDISGGVAQTNLQFASF